MIKSGKQSQDLVWRCVVDRVVALAAKDIAALAQANESMVGRLTTDMPTAFNALVELLDIATESIFELAGERGEPPQATVHWLQMLSWQERAKHVEAEVPLMAAASE